MPLTPRHRPALLLAMLASHLHWPTATWPSAYMPRPPRSLYRKTYLHTNSSLRVASFFQHAHFSPSLLCSTSLRLPRSPNPFFPPLFPHFLSSSNAPVLTRPSTFRHVLRPIHHGVLGHALAAARPRRPPARVVRRRRLARRLPSQRA